MTRPSSLNGREQRRARADHDAGFAGRRRAPHAPALRTRQRRVPFDRRAAEAALEAAHELIGERDLRQHDQRLLPALERARHRLEINLRLARAGDAVEQRHGEIRAIDRRLQRVHGARLLGAKFGFVVRRIGRGEALFRDCHLDEVARRDEPVDDAGRALRLRRERRLGADGVVGSGFERALTCRRHARRQGCALHQRHAEARLYRLEGCARAHHHAHHHAQRRQRIARDPFGEF